MSRVLDLKRECRWIGPKDERGHSWAIQDGIIFTWSESNVRFEECWWLKSDGTPIPPGPEGWSESHINALLRDRPFDPRWMTDA